MMKVKKNSPICLLAVLPFALITLLFEILPLINIVIESFTKQGGGGFTYDHFIKIFTTRLYQQSIFNSVWISLFSAFAGIVIAFLAAKAANAASVKVRNVFTSVLNITSNFAGVPLAFAFMILLGNVGILTLIGKNYGIWLSGRFRSVFDQRTAADLCLFSDPAGFPVDVTHLCRFKKRVERSRSSAWGKCLSLLVQSGHSVTDPKHPGHFLCFVCQFAGCLWNGLCPAEQ